MNEGARQANNENRHREERLHGERVEALLTEIRDLLKLFAWREAATAMDRMDADAEQPTMAIRECDVCGESVATEGTGNFLIRRRHVECGGSDPPEPFPKRALWYFPSQDRYWEATGDALANAETIRQHVDAVHVHEDTDRLFPVTARRRYRGM